MGNVPIERPFVVAHEWAHLAGYADESEANFVAWLTGLMGTKQLQDSGWLGIYDYALGAMAPPRRGLLPAADPGGAPGSSATSRAGETGPTPPSTERLRQSTICIGKRIECPRASAATRVCSRSWSGRASPTMTRRCSASNRLWASAWAVWLSACRLWPNGQQAQSPKA